MKKTLTILALLTITFCLGAQTPKYVFTEASDLNIIGKIHDNTPNPYR